MLNRIYYFPGCTFLRSKHEDSSTRAALKVLELELIDIPQWTCCGASTPPTANLTTYWAFPFRNLLNASVRGIKDVLTSCPFCYRNLTLANKVAAEGGETSKAINELIEGQYTGDVKVSHLLQFLKENITLEKIDKHVKRYLRLKVAPFYGCTLLRPREIAIDSHERPTIMEEILKTLGCEVLDFYPTKIKCCGNYLSITAHDAFTKRVYKILDQANRLGAQAIITTCSLCHYNLDKYQDEVQEKFKEFRKIPILYLSQMLSLAFGLPLDVCHFSDHKVDPRPYLERGGIIHG